MTPLGAILFPMTLYARIQHFYQRDKFRFKPRHKNDMGKRLGALWKSLHPGHDPLPLVDSIEDAGTFKVVEYPQHFTPMIDQLIRNFHQEILQASRERRAKEAADQQAAAHAALSTTPKKERKRIPVKQMPAWKSR